ncbi:hypothetical protein AAGT82_18840 [Enterobacter quasihormaechei]|uniref:Uncharacterized protein n=1 Tax=Enterobacter quasihormaechei TaxID=2529382 RepID=A0ABU9PLE4_9ENTR
MKEGYYWIRHNECVQIAYYSHGKTEDMLTGKIIHGVWHLFHGFDICDNGEAIVLTGPIAPPS